MWKRPAACRSEPSRLPLLEGPRPARRQGLADRPAAPSASAWSERAGLLIKVPSRTFLQVDPLLLRTDMSNPDDDTDVPSGFNDDAEMERTPSRSSEIRR